MGCASLSVAFVVVLAATVANVAGFNRKNTKAALKVYMAAEAAGKQCVCVFLLLPFFFFLLLKRQQRHCTAV